MLIHKTFRTGLVFSEPVKMSPNSGMLQSKLTKPSISQYNINASAQNL